MKIYMCIIVLFNAGTSALCLNFKMRFFINFYSLELRVAIPQLFVATLLVTKDKLA